MTRGELGIIASIVLATAGATWAISAVRAQDLQQIRTSRSEDSQRVIRLEAIVENQADQLRLLRENTEAVRRLFELHLNESAKPKG